MKFVYMLECIAEPDRHYVGLADDVDIRLTDHNAGRSPHTAKYRPWRLKTSVAFSDDARAVLFERSLKSHSGCAFAKKRF